MSRKNIAWLLVLIAGFCNAQQIRKKVLHMQSPAVGRYTMHILPLGYDSTITEEQIAANIDTLPGHLFASKMYNLLYKDDTNRMAVKAEEGIYLFHKRYTITAYWKNGNKKEIAYVGRHHKKYKQTNYNENATLSSFGRYRHGHKIKRWVYFNSTGLKVKVEKYAKDGTVKKTKTFDPPKKNLKTFFNPARPKGAPYIII